MEPEERTPQNEMTELRMRVERICYHSIGLIDRNREYLQMHLAQQNDENVRQALEDIEGETVRLERTLEELMGVLKLREGEQPSWQWVDLRTLLDSIQSASEEIERQTGITLTVESHSEGKGLV